MPTNTDFFDRLENRIAPYNLLTHSISPPWDTLRCKRDIIRRKDSHMSLSSDLAEVGTCGNFSHRNL